MATTETVKPRHKATYAADKKKGGWLIRISGEYPEMFAGREVPVTMKSGESHSEVLVRLIWQGVDTESGERVALYTFEAKPREAAIELDF
jgi:hypothetical protein